MKIPRTNQQKIRQLKKLYKTKKKEIISRLEEFGKCLNDKNDEGVFGELAFCLLTPQSKAQCCWDAIRTITSQNLLVEGTEDDIKGKLHRVRFHNKKARYLVGARTLFLNKGRLSIRSALKNLSDVHECRERLVRDIKGLGYKEASHFLRNIGLGDRVAILDRHILKNLVHFDVIQEIPASMSRSGYMQIEQKMADFAREIHIPLAHLDLLLWYKETGEIFK
ncbi:MAG: N-glycosylase/DNA lyase [Thermodesulfovibrionales bacterium]|nr:N-glycosylase/DNA lyase [Thermodesulfovibrionales bacterium]